MEYISSNNQPISAEQVYSDMLKRILELQLEPGQRISENQMAEEYGASRFVIRNVFTRLNQLELLTVYPQRGTFVSLIDLKYIEDLLVLRAAVEKEVLYEMFAKIEESDRLVLVEKLENNLKLQENALNEEYSKKFQELDSTFHKIMIDSVKRYRLMKILENPMLHIIRWRNLDLTFLDQRMSELIEEHRAIVNAIKENNLNKAQQAIGNHLETISKFGGKAMEKYPHYFTE